MAANPVAVPATLSDPGYLFIAPLASTVPLNTVAGGIFTDLWPAAWIPLGATEDGSQFSYNTTTEPITVAEFFDPIRYVTTAREGNFAFNLASWGLTNFRRALNGGVAALTPTSGTGATALFDLTPPAPGAEVRSMIGLESLDNTLRLVCFQTLQGGEISSAFKKAPDKAVIPCTFQFEVPASGVPFKLSGAGVARG